MPTENGFYLVHGDNACVVATDLTPQSQLALSTISYDLMKIWLFDESTQRYILSASTDGLVMDVINGNVGVVNTPSDSATQRWASKNNRLYNLGMPNMVATQSQMGSFVVVTEFDPSNAAQDFRPVKVSSMAPAQ
jgi:hypothetical protein